MPALPLLLGCRIVLLLAAAPDRALVVATLDGWLTDLLPRVPLLHAGSATPSCVSAASAPWLRALPPLRAWLGTALRPVSPMPSHHLHMHATPLPRFHRVR